MMAMSFSIADDDALDDLAFSGIGRAERILRAGREIFAGGDLLSDIRSPGWATAGPAPWVSVASTLRLADARVT